MALSTRELYLILRARDEASRVLRSAAGNISGMGNASQQAAQKHIQQGQALATIGTGIAFAGAAGLKFFNDSTNAAIKYNQQSAKTLTQVDQLGVSLEQIKTIGRNVAREIPVPFEQMQEGLYDIFSSMDVSVGEAEMLLREFSKAAVAGQTDLQTAGRATISIMNAYKMPASEVNRVNDVMFQLVRKGVGTYEEFAKSIGRSIPSAQRAGQSIEQLAGMMAFLTRNGLSTQMAATSAARALDALSHPQTVKRMEEMGISVKNASGEFRPMTEIVGQLSEKMSKLSAPERAKAMYELFKASGGTIQARRFLDLAVNNFGELNQRVSEMKNSAGVAKDAYAIMFEQPQAQLELMNNRFKVLRTEIGDRLIPVKLKLAEAVIKLFDAWDKLDPKVQTLIIKGAAFGSAFLVVAGIVTAVVGGILMLAGAAALAGVSLATVGIIIAAVVAGIAVLGAGIYLAIKYHKEIQTAAKAAWDSIRNAIQPVIDKFKALGSEILDRLAPAFKQAWRDIQDGVTAAWLAIQPAIGFIKQAWQDLVILFTDSALATALQWLGNVAFAVLRIAIMNVVDMIKFLVEVIGGVLGPAIAAIGGIISGLVQVIAGVIKIIKGIFTGDWSEIWKGATMIVQGAVKMTTSLLQGLFNIAVNIIISLGNAVISRFKWMWDNVISKVTSAIATVIRSIASLPGKAYSALGSLGGLLVNVANSAWNRFRSSAANQMASAVSTVQGLPRRIYNALGNLGGLLYGAGKAIMQGFWNGLKDQFGPIISWASSVASKIAAVKGPKNKDLKILRPAGRWIMQGLRRGLLEEYPGVESVFERITNRIGSYSATPTAAFDRFTQRPVDGVSAGTGAAPITVNQNIYTQEIDPRAHAAMLGYDVARRLSR